MENQHKKIKGYRSLNQEEIDLMNRIKSKGAELLELQLELSMKLEREKDTKRLAFQNALLERGEAAEDSDEWWRFQTARPCYWVESGRNQIELGVMCLVRAVAQPEN